VLTLTTSSTDAQFTTTAAVKTLLGITDTADDALLDSYITQASRWAENYIGHGPLSAQSYRETAAGFGGRNLQLSHRPVRAITGFWDATDTGTATTMLTTEYRLDADVGMLSRDAGWAWDAPGVPRPFALPLAAAYWAGEEAEPWMVDYVAGWTYSGLSTASDNWSTVQGTTSTGRTVPEDIELAVQLRVLALQSGDLGVVERSVGDLRVKYQSGDEGSRMDPAEELLAPYRSFA